MNRITILLCALLPLGAATTYAGNAFDNFSQASEASVEASTALGDSAAASTEGSFRVLAGAAAVPLWMVGKPAEALGKASADAGDTLWETSTGEDVRHAPEQATAAPATADPTPAQALACRD
ncbi:MAG: hypothetical protein E1N59_1297 [Puniceicoccaceae bacterium 5H]|nr:MAG: hypothetical protein E1N59_1297 [Puniceicoccaceae bacterium 5H]